MKKFPIRVDQHDGRPLKCDTDSTVAAVSVLTATGDELDLETLKQLLELLSDVHRMRQA